MQLGEKVRQLRKRAAISQVDLARRLGITRRALIYVETGERNPGPDLLNKLADFFDVAVEFLTDDRQALLPTKEEKFLAAAKEENAEKGISDARKYLETTHGLFAGGALSDDDKDALFEVLTEIYFDAKKKSRKFGTRKNAVSAEQPNH